jgi:hypothetical protein
VTFRSRLLLALLLVAGLTGLILLGQFRGDSTIARASGWSHEDCRQCHQRVWDEWESSGHAKAWTSDSVQAMFQHFGHDRKCQSCHAAEPLLVTGLDQPPALRTADVASGVNCLTCHATGPQRTVAAARDLPEAPCKPVATASLSKGQSCAACHVAIYKDWAESRYQAEGKTCQTCHMRSGSDKDARPSHACPGAYDDALVRSGAKLQSRVEGEELVVEVINHATGHNYPGERHNRSLILQVIEHNAEGGIELARQELIKGITPFRGETSAERLKVDETFEARFPIVSPAMTADVQLLYKRFPWHPDRDALVVHREEIKLPAAEK